MKIQINGESREVPDGLTVTTLIEHEKVKQPLMVTVEYNGEILDRDAFPATAINDGDVVEFLYFMGGGN
jgi:sulfur carrier protein